MAITYTDGAQSNNGGSAVASFAIPVPTAGGALAAGDFLIAVWSYDTANTSAPTRTLPSGWTSLPGSPQMAGTSTTTVGIEFAYHVVTAGEAGTSPTWTVTFTSGSYVSNVAVSRFAGVDSSTPFAMASPFYAITIQNTGTSTKSVPSVTTTAANAMLVTGTGVRNGSGALTSQPSGYTLGGNAFLGAGRSVALAHVIQATAGTSGGTPTWTTATAGVGSAWHIALNPAVAGASGTVALTGSGTLTLSGSGGGAGTVALTGTGTLVLSGSGTLPPPPGPTPAVPPGEWSAFARGTVWEVTVALPIIEATAVLRHMGLSKGVLTTPYTAERWEALQPGCGIALYRSGKRLFSGPVTSRQLTYSAEDGSAIIRIEAVGDEVIFADRLTFPDPLRAAGDQSVNDYWTYTGSAARAMYQLMRDQAQGTCRFERQVENVEGVTLDIDYPADVGATRTWQGLFEPVLTLLSTIAASSGADLGLRVVSRTGVITATVIEPRDFVGEVIFSADLSNLGGAVFAEQAPELTEALVAGQGDLHLRARQWVSATNPGTTRWRRKVYKYVDRRDTADASVLTNAGIDSITDGQASVSLSLTLVDSNAATYGVDWDLGDRVTVYIGLPGESKVAQVNDVVREITFTIRSDGSERIQPAVGSVDARTYLPTPAQRALTSTARQITDLARQK